MNAEENELLRHAVLECVVARHPTSLSEGGIARRVRREVDFEFDGPAVLSALELLRGMGLVEAVRDDFGKTVYWMATAPGVLHVERA